MKRCSTCNRTYTDPNLSFCIDDGTPLTPVAADDDDTTVVQPQSAEENNWNAAPYQPPSYVPPGNQGRRRRLWPWIVGILGAFIVGIVAISIAAAILAPRLLRSRENPRASSNVNKPENANTAAPTNSNVNTNETVESPPPTDHAQVLAELRDIENDWTVANLNADKKALDRILADDFVGQGPEGEPQSKADYIRIIERDTSVEKWEFSDLKLTLIGDRATLSGKITYEFQDGTRDFDFIDKFVWRDGRWQATSAELKGRE